MNKILRVITFLSLLTILSIIIYYWKGSLFPTDVVGVVLYSGLVMMAFIALFVEHFFTKPTDVLSTTIAILLLIAPLRNELNKFGEWYNLFFFYNIILAIVSITSILLFNSSSSEDYWSNKISSKLKNIAIYFGNGKLLFFLLVALTLLFYVDSQSSYFLIVFFFAILILIVNPQKFFVEMFEVKSRPNNDVGKIFGVQSKNTFLVKLFEDRVSIKIFDFVEFKYSMDDNEKNKIRRGLILDNYLLNQEQWIKVLVTNEIQQIFKPEAINQIKEDNVVYKISEPEKSDYLERFVGIVTDNSNISKIRFIYNSKVKVSEGQLLEIKLNETSVLYQIVQGLTQIEPLEQKNETGLIIGEAIQLGIWIPEKMNFEKYGWVADINAPVYIASKIDPPAVKGTEYIIGNIPDSNYPVIIDKQIAISHHLAVLGVTGSGKSVYTRNLIKQIIKDETKVICVDFTGEYKTKFPEIKNIVDDTKSASIFNSIDIYTEQMEEFPNKRNKTTIDNAETNIKDNFKLAIEEFLTGHEQLALFELPDVTNTTGILEYTKRFFRELFLIAKKENNFGKKVCVVLEEAHTVIPEWNFIGIGEKNAQSLVNSIGQIALQGRKYNIGFIVIAQRTANVSKTILTQCNSIIAFQEFDNTSKDFLSNYLGTEMVNALPNLKFRQAIAVGKAFKSNIPLIFEVPEIIE